MQLKCILFKDKYVRMYVCYDLLTSIVNLTNHFKTRIYAIKISKFENKNSKFSTIVTLH